MAMNKNGSTTGPGGQGTLEQRFESIKESVRGLVDRGGERAERIRNRVVEVTDQAKVRGNDVLSRTTELIRANPLKAVAIAFGLGYIGMRLFRR
jgi:ElaB/YqjD/DUF883 family membrane-anchored ribosome-binding protein